MSKGELEQEINSLTAKIYKEMLGKGPKKVKSTICEDVVVIRIERCQTTILRHLVNTPKGREVLKAMREKLFEFFEEDAKKRYQNVVKKKVKEIYYGVQKFEKEIVLTIICEKNIL